MTHADTPRSPSAAPTAPASPASPVPAGPSADAGAAPAPVDWSEESTAGEEDPGASLDMALDPPSPPEVPQGQAAVPRSPDAPR